MPPSASTRRKLERNGRKARLGDRIGGVWVVGKTRWYGFTDGTWVYLIKGSRCPASFEFNGRMGWEMVAPDLSQLLDPSRKYKVRGKVSLVPPTLWRRIWWWFWPWSGPEEA